MICPTTDRDIAPVTPRRQRLEVEINSESAQVMLRRGVHHPRIFPLKYELSPPLRSMGRTPVLSETWTLDSDTDDELNDSPTAQALDRRTKAIGSIPATSQDLDFWGGCNLHVDADTGIPPSAQYANADLAIAGGYTIFMSTNDGFSMDPSFLDLCHIQRFDPADPAPETNFDILMRLTQGVGGGVTPAELRGIVRQCKECSRFVYLERQGLHRCDSMPQVFNPDGFQVASSLLSLNQNSGIHATDLYRCLMYCGHCDRICFEGALNYHTCA